MFLQPPPQNTHKNLFVISTRKMSLKQDDFETQPKLAQKHFKHHNLLEYKLQNNQSNFEQRNRQILRTYNPPTQQLINKVRIQKRQSVESIPTQLLEKQHIVQRPVKSIHNSKQYELVTFSDYVNDRLRQLTRR